MHDLLSLKKHLASYQNESAGSYIHVQKLYMYTVCNITYMEETDRSVD